MIGKLLTMTIPEKGILTQTNYKNHENNSKDSVSVLVKKITRLNDKESKKDE